MAAVKSYAVYILRVVLIKLAIKSDNGYGRKVSIYTLTGHILLKTRMEMPLIGMGEAMGGGRCWEHECPDQMIKFARFNLETFIKFVLLYLWERNTCFYFQFIIS